MVRRLSGFSGGQLRQGIKSPPRVRVCYHEAKDGRLIIARFGAKLRAFGIHYLRGGFVRDVLRNSSII